MMMSHIQQFFSMGGYGWYVWSAYGLVATVLIGVLWRQAKQFSWLLNTMNTIAHSQSPLDYRNPDDPMPGKLGAVEN